LLLLISLPYLVAYAASLPNDAGKPLCLLSQILPPFATAFRVLRAPDARLGVRAFFRAAREVSRSVVLLVWFVKSLTSICTIFAHK
jgi:hypothetical protein